MQVIKKLNHKYFNLYNYYSYKSKEQYSYFLTVNFYRCLELKNNDKTN